VTLYRAAEPEGAHFGFNSHWSSSRTYVEDHFALSAARSITYPRRLVLWTVEVDIPSPAVLDLRPVEILEYVSFDNRTCAGSYSVEGADWVIATVRDSDNAVVEMAIYLGDTPLRPMHATE
jgi:hypothetical protein